MIVRLAAFVAAASISMTASAQQVNSHAVVAKSVVRSVALEKIIGRVQLDVLIDHIVSSDIVKPTHGRGVAYASVGSAKVRDRS